MFCCLIRPSTLFFACLLLASCGPDGPDTTPPSPAEPPRQSLTLAEAPAYAVGLADTLVPGVGESSVGFARQEVIFQSGPQ